MFTGIVKSIGSVDTLKDDRLIISTDDQSFINLEIGTSIAIDGCCLTLKDYINNNLLFQISDETISRTSLNLDHCGFVNMELPLTANSFLSGHIVQGHVDAVIKLEAIEKLLLYSHGDIREGILEFLCFLSDLKMISSALSYLPILIKI